MPAPLEIGLMLGNPSPVPEERFGRLHELGVRCCHIGLNKAQLSQQLERQIADLTLYNGYEITTIFCGFDGESYAD